jgi:hypothetical protein
MQLTIFLTSLSLNLILPLLFCAFQKTRELPCLHWYPNILDVVTQKNALIKLEGNSFRLGLELPRLHWYPNILEVVTQKML